MHDNHKLIEKAVIGLVAAAISVNLLAAALPIVTPYLVVLAVIWVIVRLILYHTKGW